MSRDYPQMKLRMPPELRDQVEESAKANGRSMNAEIIHRLEQAFKDDGLLREINHKLDRILEKGEANDRHP